MATPISSKASALQFIANRINTDLEKYSNRSGASNIKAKVNGLALLFSRLAIMAETQSPLETKDMHFLRVSREAQNLLLKQPSEENKLFEFFRSYWLAIDKDMLDSTGLSTPSPFAEEIRSSIKAMSSGDRTNKMISLIKEKDSSTLGAIYEAPAFLSGLQEAEKESHFSVFFSQYAPELLKERKNLDDILSSQTAFMKAYKKGLQEFVDVKRIRDIERQSEQASVAQAELAGALRASI